MKSKDIKYHIQTNIKASKILKKLAKSAYGYNMVNGIFVGLPASGMKGKWVQLTIPPLPPSAIVPIGHIGPWNGGGWNNKFDDPYWRKNHRPQTESGKDLRNKITDKSGIQLSNRLWVELGIGKMKNTYINWHFVASPKNKKAVIINKNRLRNIYDPY